MFSILILLLPGSAKIHEDEKDAVECRLLISLTVFIQILTILSSDELPSVKIIDRLVFLMVPNSKRVKSHW